MGQPEAGQLSLGGRILLVISESRFLPSFSPEAAQLWQSMHKQD